MNNKKIKSVVSKLALLIIVFSIFISIISKKEFRKRVSVEFELKSAGKEIIGIQSDNMINNKYIFPGNNFSTMKFIFPKKDIKNIYLKIINLKRDLLIRKISFISFLSKHEFKDYQLKNIFSPKRNIRKVRFRNNMINILKASEIKLNFNNKIVELVNMMAKNRLKYSIVILIIFLILIYFILNFQNLKISLVIFKKNCLITSIFLLVLSTPFMNDLLKFITPDLLNNQNGFQDNKDTLGNGDNGFLKKFGNDYAHNTEIRPLLVRMNNLIHVKFLKTSPIQKILLGSDGWMFLARENRSRDQRDYYRNVKLFSLKELKKWYHYLNKRYQFLKEKGIEYYFIFAPGKMSIYSEKLPFGLKKYNCKSRLDQLISYLKKRSFQRVIDVRKELLSAKKINRVYFKTGSHWNELGAFIAYKKIIDRLKVDFKNLTLLSLNDFKVLTELKEGDDFPKMLSIEKKVKENRIRLIPNHLFSAYLSPFKLENDSTKFSYTYREKGLPLKLLYIHDSFISGIKRYLAETFQKADYYWNYSHKLNLKMFLNGVPAIVIDEMAERFLWDFDPENLNIQNLIIIK